MKYQSEIVNEILEQRGHEKSSLHYESECVETWINETKGAYPKLCDYEGEWLNYINENPIGDFPYETLTDITEATVNNVVPYAYKSAILKGCTKYRDIDTGEILETFEDGRNLELVSVKMPVLTTTGKNLVNPSLIKINTTLGSDGVTEAFFNGRATTDFIKIKPNTTYAFGGNGFDQYYYNEYDISKNPIGSRKSTPQSFTSASNTHYVRFFRYSILDTALSSINEVEYSLEEGSVATSYEPYKSNILSTSEDVVLRKVGDVQDELNLLTGEVTERIGEIVLDGSQSMGADSNGVFIQVNDVKRLTNYTNSITCDKLPVLPTYGHLANVENGISAYTNANGYLGQNWLYVRINNSINKDEIKQWLSQNPITVQYQLATESIKTVDLSVTDQDGNQLTKIKPIEGTMHITTDGTPIKPTFTGEIPVEAITQNLASFIEE